MCLLPYQYTQTWVSMRARSQKKKKSRQANVTWADLLTEFRTEGLMTKHPNSVLKTTEKKKNKWEVMWTSIQQLNTIPGLLVLYKYTALERIVKVSQTCSVFSPKRLASNANLRHCLGKSDATHIQKATITLAVKAGLLNVHIPKSFLHNSTADKKVSSCCGLDHRHPDGCGRSHQEVQISVFSLHYCHNKRGLKARALPLRMPFASCDKAPALQHCMEVSTGAVTQEYSSYGAFH